MGIVARRPDTIALCGRFIAVGLALLATTSMSAARLARAADGPAVLFVADGRHGSPEFIRTWNDWLEAGFEIDAKPIAKIKSIEVAQAVQRDGRQLPAFRRFPASCCPGAIGFRAAHGRLPSGRRRSGCVLRRRAMARDEPGASPPAKAVRGLGSRGADCRQTERDRTCARRAHCVQLDERDRRCSHDTGHYADRLCGTGVASGRDQADHAVGDHG